MCLLKDFAPIFEKLAETMEDWSKSAYENVKKRKAS